MKKQSAAVSTKHLTMTAYAAHIGDPWVTAWLARDINGRRGVYVPLSYMDMTGNHTDAIMLGEILYWFDVDEAFKVRATHWFNDQLWIVRQTSEWMERCRIPERQARVSLERLAAKQLIYREIHLSPFHKNPNGTYQRASFIRPNWPMIRLMMTLWVMHQSGEQMTENVISEVTENVISEVTENVISQMTDFVTRLYTISTTVTTPKKTTSPAPLGAKEPPVPPSKEKSGSPNGGTNGRKKDPVFDAVAEWAFGIKPGTPITKRAAPRIGLVKKAAVEVFCAFFEEMNEEVLARIITATYSRHVNVLGETAARDATKFAEQLTAYIQDNLVAIRKLLAAPPASVAEAPADEEGEGDEDEDLPADWLQRLAAEKRLNF